MNSQNTSQCKTKAVAQGKCELPPTVKVLLPHCRDNIDARGNFVGMGIVSGLLESSEHARTNASKASCAFLEPFYLRALLNDCFSGGIATANGLSKEEAQRVTLITFLASRVLPDP